MLLHMKLNFTQNNKVQKNKHDSLNLYLNETSFLLDINLNLHNSCVMLFTE